MLSKNNPQIDILSQMIFDKLVPDDHLLVKINSKYRCQTPNTTEGKRSH